MARYQVSELDSIDELIDGGVPFRPIRLHFGITSFGITTRHARAAGDLILNEHDEQDVGDEELFLVLRGRARFEIDGDRIDAPSGTLVFCPVGTPRTAIGEEAETTILALDAKPGKPYEARGWELWTTLAPLFGAGEHAEVARRLRAIVDEHPEYPLLYYNLACAESLTGQSTEALDHLRQAIVLNDEFRALAPDDGDFASLHDDPGFKELTGR